MSTCPKSGLELTEDNSKEVFDENGNMFLVHESVETKRCTVCGKEHVIKNESEMYLIFDDSMQLVCQECQRKHKYVICNYCGEWHKKSETEKVNRLNVCKKCLDEKFTVCADCGKFMAKADAKETHYGTFVCQNCSRNYVSCQACGTLLRDADITTTDDNYSLCAECLPTRTRVCHDCGGRFYSTGSGSNSLINGESIWFCSNCSERNVAVHQYGYKPVGGFQKEDGEDTLEYFGAEIEVSGSQEHARSFLEIMNGDKKESNVYLKNDCSIVSGGFECVTKPMTREYIYKSFLPKLRSGVEFLGNNNFKGHNMGGIHIHTSKNNLTAHDIARLVSLVYTTNTDERNLWLTLTQRDSNGMTWGDVSQGTLNTGSKSSTISQITSGNIDWKNGFSNDRRTAINIQRNASTVEFRLFNSSTRVDRIMTRYELIFSLLDFAKLDEDATLVNWFKYVSKNASKYSYFNEFLIEKGIVNENEKTITLFETTHNIEEVA